MRQFDFRTGFSWLTLLAPALVAMGCGEDADVDEEATDTENVSVVADTYAATSENRLVYFKRSSGEIRSSTSVTGLAAAETIIGLDFRPADGALYALVTGGKLYSVDLSSGRATLKSTLSADAADTSSPYAGLDGDVFGVNFNPVADRLRVVSNDGQNLRINVDTGATTTDAPLNPGTPSVTAAAYSNSFAAACRTRLYVIDTSTGKLLLQDPPNAGTLTEIGDLGTASAGADSASFEVVTGSDGVGRALALFPTADGTTIYDLDLTTAALSAPRTLALREGESLRGTSAAPPATAPAQAPGELLGVTVNDRLVSFNRGAPGKLCTNAAITGLNAGEGILGVDIRPADGDLYALTDGGKVVTLDVATGAATLVSTLSADASDMTAPFTALADGAVGVGFNPVPDRLRVVSRDGQNLRINVDTGATTTDASMSPESMSVGAVAYTNAYAGATSTTLYALDTSGSLTRIGGAPATGGACPDDTNNPNCGNVTVVGPFGVTDVSDVNGFDIDGDPSATAATSAFAALTIGNATSSSLYVIDLATGAAAPPTGVANPTIGGGEALRELTLAANPVVTPAP
jgi:uncharacterized protein DUF4394